MDHTKLMKLVPTNYDLKSNKSREYLKKVVNVVFKIALIKGYNSSMNILYNGSYISETNVVDYVFEIFEMDKLVDDRFILLLLKAEILPEMFLNTKAKNQLNDLIVSHKQQEAFKPEINKKIVSKLSPKTNSIKTSDKKMFAPKDKVLKIKNFNWEEASDSE